MKHEIYINSIFSEFHEEWMSDTDKKDCNNKILQLFGRTMEQLDKDIEFGLRAGYTLQSQKKLIHEYILAKNDASSTISIPENRNQIYITEGKSDRPINNNMVARVFINRDFDYGYFIPEKILFELISESDKGSYIDKDTFYVSDTAVEIIKKLGLTV